jgi:hypothetical protein
MVGFLKALVITQLYNNTTYTHATGIKTALIFHVLRDVRTLERSYWYSISS